MPLSSPTACAFQLARQPIIDRRQNIAGYELLFRAADAHYPVGISDLAATSSVIACATQVGLTNIVGKGVAYVNVDAAVLMSDIFNLLPRERIVLEIVETMRVTPAILERIAQLQSEGFRFALDDVIADTDDVRQLLPFIEIIKFDLRDMPLSALLNLTPRFKLAGKKLLAEKVESIEQFKVCHALGFDFFQGYFFAQPALVSGTHLMPSDTVVAQLMHLIDNNATDIRIEDAIKNDLALTFHMLRLANSQAREMHARVDSLAAALENLGRDQLRRWLQVLLHAESANMTPQADFHRSAVAYP